MKTRGISCRIRSCALRRGSSNACADQQKIEGLWVSRKEVLRPTVPGAYQILQNQVCDVHYRLPGSGQFTEYQG